ncbi:hypothetical protein IMZ31_22160 (plasmid) [Pontibacillus sp. ALD_SL1]|uniref:hypothetical protein n=1 Tax=Pontibacillus sp. ALD_SL1 TaxID=2777185 RepID=UPI001A977333|nr:hypothetical protein [Pontibacillus sp. ALD_SL1]QST02159.1 hypothetical protein IMZ31_22160 [Pontibacillus sp. ALD_SL1]
MKRLLVFIKEIESEEEKHVDLLLIDEERLEHSTSEMFLRRVIEDFLNTEAGKEAIEESMDDFNWGDVANRIPYDHWSQCGIELVYENSTISFGKQEVVVVDHDEVLIP